MSGLIESLFNSTQDISGSSVLKDLYLVSITVLWSYVYYTEGTSLTRIVLGFILLLGPIILFWTPWIQKRSKFRNISEPRNRKYQWTLFLSLILLPFIGTIILASRIFIFYQEKSVEDYLGISSKKKVDSIAKKDDKNDKDTESGKAEIGEDTSSEISASANTALKKVASADYGKWSRIFGAAGRGGIKGIIAGGFVGTITFLAMAYFEMPVIGSYLAATLAILTYIGQMMDSAQTKKEQIEHRQG